MATIRSLVEMEDRMSSQIDNQTNAMIRLENQMENTRDKLNSLENSYASNERAIIDNEFKLDAAAKAQARLDRAMTTGIGVIEAAGDAALMSAKDFERLNNETLRLSASQDTLIDQIRRTERSLEEQEIRYQRLAQEARAATTESASGFESLAGKIVMVDAAINLVSRAFNFLSGLWAEGEEFITLSEKQSEAQTKLATTMRNTQGATNDQIRAMMNYADAQERVGIVSSWNIMQGASQMASMQLQQGSIEKLIPAMNNLAAFQGGLNVSQSNVTQSAKLLGLAMQGNYTAFTRLGVIITDTEKKMLSAANEQERAIKLTELIARKTGDMNEALAATPHGEILQATNAIETMNASIGDSLVMLKAGFMQGFMEIQSSMTSPILTAVEFIRSHLDEIAVSLVTLGLTATVVGGTIAAAWLIANWPIALIITAIGLVIWMVNKAGLTVSEVLEGVGKGLGFLYAFFNNIYSLLWNVTINLLQLMANSWANHFDAVISIGERFALGFIGIIEKIATLMDKVFNTGLSEAASNVRALVKQKAEEAKIGDIDLSIMERSYTSFKESISIGGQVGKDLGDKIQVGLNKMGEAITNWEDVLGGMGQEPFEFDGLGNLKTANQNDIKIKDEDIKMLHDTAKGSYMINYQDMPITVDVRIDKVEEAQNADSLVDYVIENLVEAMNSRLSIPEAV